MIEYNPSLNVLFLSLLLAFSAARALGQCAGKVSSPAAVADCAARETPREGKAILDPVHPYTLAELIDVAEHHNPSTRTIWERAKQKARELGLAKAAYYPELDGLAVFGDERLINPFPKPLAPRGYVMVEVPIVRPEVTLQYLIFDFGKREASVDSAKAGEARRGCRRHSGKSSAGVSRRQCVLPVGDRTGKIAGRSGHVANCTNHAGCG